MKTKKQKQRITYQPPLDVYLNRDIITEKQYNAGQRLYREWFRAGRMPVLCFSYNQRVARGQNIAAEESKEHARQSYISALKALGHQYAGVAISVCLMDEWAKDWAIRSNINQRHGIARLRIALDNLASHYKIN